jgi:hypothetical protein
VIDNNHPNGPENAVFDYNLGETYLVLPDISNIPIGSYSGTVNWSLDVTP